MYQSTPLTAVYCDCQGAITQITQALVAVGLHVVCSFDLQAARDAHTNCTCPHHGTAQCDCQMVVLLVYDRSSQPVTLVAHGHDRETHLAYVDHPDQHPDPQLIAKIRSRLEGAVLIKPALEK